MLLNSNLVKHNIVLLQLDLMSILQVWMMLETIVNLITRLIPLSGKPPKSGQT